MASPDYTIYTDGGCQPNPGPGGWAAIILDPSGSPTELSGASPDSTNNRMEITAALEALRSLPAGATVELVTDSTYLKNGMTQWIAGWRRKGWVTAAKQPVKNQDLWRALDTEVGRHTVRWRWTRGHSGDRWNERADELATQARGERSPAPTPDLPTADTGAVHAFLGAAWSGKTGRGGWAVVLTCDGLERELTGEITGQSANAAHLLSALGALEALRKPLPVHVYTGSDYLEKGATSWLQGWKRNGWQTAGGKPVASRELWQDLDLLLARRERSGHTIHWHLVGKDDAPDELERARKLARAVAKR